MQVAQTIEKKVFYVAIFYGFFVYMSCTGSKTVDYRSIKGVMIGNPLCKPKKLHLQSKDTYLCQDMTFFLTTAKRDDEPLTVEEEFENAFKGNYYAKFFEKIHIDSKLYKLFRDSVSLLTVTDTNQLVKPLFNCSACNKLATLKFRNREYCFPFYWSSSENQGLFTIHMDTLVNYKRKIWIANQDDKPSGVTIRYADKNFVTVFVTNTIDRQKVYSILSEIKLF